MSKDFADFLAETGADDALSARDLVAVAAYYHTTIADAGPTPRDWVIEATATAGLDAGRVADQLAELCESDVLDRVEGAGGDDVDPEEDGTATYGVTFAGRAYVEGLLADVTADSPALDPASVEAGYYRRLAVGIEQAHEIGDDATAAATGRALFASLLADCLRAAGATPTMDGSRPSLAALLDRCRSVPRIADRAEGTLEALTALVDTTEVTDLALDEHYETLVEIHDDLADAGD